jgi:hypothetical protein
MASDNNLDVDSLNEIRDIFSATPNPDFRLLIEIDRYKTYCSAEKESRKTKRIVKEGDKSLEFSIAEGSTGEAIVLQDFLNWGANEYPADGAIVILWGHGHGWRGCADDYSTRDILTLNELNRALSVVQNQGRFQLLGFDMCQMATLEVLFEVADECEYVIASQNVEPPDGWYYERLLSEPYENAMQFGTAALHHFKAYYLNKGLDAYTLSLLKTAPVKELATLIGQLARLGQSEQSVFEELLVSRTKSLDFKYEKYVDLGDLISTLAKHTDNKEVVDVCSKINSLLNEVIVHRVAGPKYKGSRGLSIYFPENISEEDIKEYAHISFSRAYGGWNDLLISLKNRHL